MSLGDEQWRFIHYVIRQASVAAAVQHAKIYVNGVTPTQRAELRNILYDLLDGHVAEYQKEVKSDRHCQNIKKLAKTVSTRFNNILVLINGEPRFRIGIAQKALNLYLKFLWCLEKIPPPPHCPFDGTILGELERQKRLEDPEPWTRMNCIEEYRRWVEAAREQAKGDGFSSIARWELRLFESRGAARVS